VRYKIAIILVVVFFLNQGRSQDIHFSQFNESPLTLNPAYAGMYSGDYRFVMNFKEQWAVIKNSYKTYAASFDCTLLKNSKGLKSTGIGLNFFQDIAGTSKTKTTRIDLDISQTVYLTSESDLTLGVGFSYMDMSANYLQLLWATQWDGQEFDEGLPTIESFTFLSKKAPDISGGLLYRKFDINGYPLELGFSVYHFLRPEVGMVLLPQGGYDVIPLKFAFHGNKEFNFSRNGNWGGHALGFATLQRTAKEVNTGFLLRRDFGMVSQYTGFYRNLNIYLGALYRWGDAIVIMSKVLYKGAYSLGLSYDINISPLAAATRYRGGFEISLSYNGLFTNDPVATPKTLKAF